MSGVDEAEVVAFNNAAANLIESAKPMYGIAYGSAYEKALDVVEIAKRVRSQLKTLAASDHSEVSGASISVRVRRFAGGRAIDVKVGLPFPIEPDEGDIGLNGFPAYLNPRASAAKRLASAVLDSYNYDGSDTMTDYFHVNYYGHADVHEVTS